MCTPGPHTARHTRRRLPQLIGSLRPWDGYLAVPSPPRLSPNGEQSMMMMFYESSSFAHGHPEETEGSQNT